MVVLIKRDLQKVTQNGRARIQNGSFSEFTINQSTNQELILFIDPICDIDEGMYEITIGYQYEYTNKAGNTTRSGKYSYIVNFVN